jgi:hypothetical protein
MEIETSSGVSYIRSVYDRLSAETIERCVSGWEVDFDRDKMFLEIHFPENGYNRACWEIGIYCGEFHAKPVCSDSDYRYSDLIDICRLLNAMNAVVCEDLEKAKFIEVNDGN